MSAVSIAVNRFGLGGRLGVTPGGDPRRALLDQFRQFDPRPPEIAAAPTSAQAAEALGAYLQSRVQARRAAAMSTGAQPGTDAANPAPAGGGQPFARREVRQAYDLAVGARTQAAIETQTPFVERLVHFWANHFAVSTDKLTVVGLAGTLEFEAIRPHVLGRFGDMLQAVERHPAMLLYLDQVQSVGPDSPAGRFAGRGGRKLGLNENLAREILELHTLGVRSVYSQADVTEFARALTGWSAAGVGQGALARRVDAGATPGDFVFQPRRHEPGVRTVLGRSWAQAGEAQASAILDLLATHPATARHVSTKLARHFAGDDPPGALVDRLEAAFLRSGGDLPTLYRVLVEAPECWDDAPRKFKSPWEWAISALRATDAAPIRPEAAARLFAELGQPVWKPGSPAGWDDVAASWMGPEAVLRRVELAQRFAERIRPGVDPRVLATQLFPDALSASTAQAIARAESPTQGLALLLVSPEFMRR